MAHCSRVALRVNPWHPADSDSDGIDDWAEIYNTGTDPTDPDTDADGLRDGPELDLFNTDPLNPDTDGGGVWDGEEVLTAETDPLDPEDDTVAPDCPGDMNGDGLLDNGDIIAFIAGFLSGDPATDLNDDGNGDIILFVSLFLAGC